MTKAAIRALLDAKRAERCADHDTIHSYLDKIVDLTLDTAAEVLAEAMKHDH